MQFLKDPRISLSLSLWRARNVIEALGLGLNFLPGFSWSEHFFSYINGWLDMMSHRKRRENKQQLIWRPNLALLGYCLVSLPFLCDILSSRPVECVRPRGRWQCDHACHFMLVNQDRVHWSLNQHGLHYERLPGRVTFYTLLYCTG